MKTCTALILLALAGGAYGAEIYRWVDDKGVVNYARFPPPPNVKNVEQKKLGDNNVQTSEAPYSAQQAIKNFPVTFYATADCGELCKTAREHLDKRGVPYTEKNPATPASSEEFDAFKKFTGGGLQVPLLVVGQLTTLKGYLASEWNAALDQAGYPTTAIPGTKPAAKPATSTAASPAAASK